MRRVLIAGCGYVGKETARLFSKAGWEVIGVVRSEDSASALRGEPFEVRVCDISNAREVAGRLNDLSPLDLAINCASSSRGGAESYRQVYLEGTRNLLEIFPEKLILTSSTSVYAQDDGSWVTEESPAEPERETGKILRESEELVLEEPGGIVARLAGIYGPGRAIFLKRFFEKSAVIEGDGNRFINQIHRDDAASALFFLGTQVAGPGIYNVSDDTPLTLLECYGWLSRHFGQPLPPFGPVNTERKRGATNKRVNNAKLRGLGWSPRFASFQDAILETPELLEGLPSSPPSP